MDENFAVVLDCPSSRSPAITQRQSIGDREQAWAGIGRVLVSLTEEAYVRADRVAEFECHLRSSRTVLPMRIGTPSGTGIGRVTFCRSR